MITNTHKQKNIRRSLLSIFFLIAALSCTSIQLLAIEDYKPLLVEGKSWKIWFEYPRMDDESWDRYYTYSVSGDTIVDGLTCKIVVNDETGSKTVLLEHDKVIWRYVGFPTYPIFVPCIDFNLHKGDNVGANYQFVKTDERYRNSYILSELFVLTEDEVEIDGISYRRLGVGSEGGSVLDYWVEGIGAYGECYITLWPRPTGPYYYIRFSMHECRENGECIFTKDDFFKGTLSGVESVALPVADENAVYDLQGRRRDDIGKGEIYIRGGKKMLKH
ncbi:MAG: hypothetical protein J6J93_08365 [Muribaculaceae bacterium]|nr:hypothetical protein [Muribaculaceae bacterium]